MSNAFDLTPAVINWYLTKRCNLTCTHCYNYEPEESPRAGANELTREQALELMDRLADAGVFALVFLGGEVFTVPWLTELAARGTQRGIQIKVATNGTLVRPDNADALWDAGVRDVQVSLDGDRLEHDAIRGEGAFDRSLRGLRILRARGFHTEVAFTFMASNKHCLEPLLALCEAEGVGAFKLHGYIPSGRSTQELAQVPSADDVRAAVMRLRELERANPEFWVTYPCYTGHIDETNARRAWRVGERAKTLSCGAGSVRGVIWEDGSVGACEFFRSESVGDLRTQRLAEIWASGNESLEKWRRLELVGGKCGSCGYQADCGFGCRAIAHYAGGDFYGGDPSCISAPPPGETHPYDLVQDRQRPPRRISLSVVR